MNIRPLLCLLLLATSSVSAPLLAQTPPPAQSLSRIVHRVDGPWPDVEDEARWEAASDGPMRLSAPAQTPAYEVFEGEIEAYSDQTRLGIFSDDGCDVYINGQKVWSRLNQGQALPNLPQSLHKVPFSMALGNVYQVKVVYSNTVYLGNADIDGVTLFVYEDDGSVTPQPTPTATPTPTPTPSTTATQPDVSLRPVPTENAPEPVWTGAGLASSGTGSHSLSVLATAGQSATYELKVKNVGNQARPFVLSLPAPPTGWNVQLFDALENGTDITTAALSQNGWTTPVVSPNETKTLRLVVASTDGAQASQYQGVVQVADGQLKDQVTLQQGVQKLAGLQWSNDGTTWNNVTPGTLLQIEQYGTIGLRGLKTLEIKIGPQLKSSAPPGLGRSERCKATPFGCKARK